MNNRGVLRVLEATIAVMIVLGALLIFSVSRDPRVNEDLTAILPPILEEFSQSSQFREKIFQFNLANINSAPNELIITELTNEARTRVGNPALDVQIRICNAGEVCPLSPFPEGVGEIYSAQRIVSSEGTNYSPRILKIFLWRIP